MKYIAYLTAALCLCVVMACSTAQQEVQNDTVNEPEIVVQQVLDGRWLYLHRKANWLYYYDPKSVVASPEGFLTVSMRVINAGIPEGATEVQEYDVHNLTASFMKDIEEEIVQIDMKCSEKQRRTYKNTIRHKKYGEMSIVTAESNVPTLWRSITGHWDKYLYEKVCQPQQQ